MLRAVCEGIQDLIVGCVMGLMKRSGFFRFWTSAIKGRKRHREMKLAVSLVDGDKKTSTRVLGELNMRDGCRDALCRISSLRLMPNFRVFHASFPLSRCHPTASYGIALDSPYQSRIALIRA